VRPTIEVDTGVGRVVVALVEGAELLEGQLRDLQRVAARVHGIRVVREERLGQPGVAELGVRLGAFGTFKSH
jgi:hypothetical protein